MKPPNRHESSSDSSEESQCPELSSTKELEDDPYVHERVSSLSSMDDDTLTIGDPMVTGQVSQGPETVNNGDSDNLSSCEEEWDETDIELDDSNTEELHPLAKPFVKWIAALILGFQAACVLPNSATQWIFTSLHILFATLRTVCPTPFLLAVCTLLPGSLYLAWRLLKVDENEFIRYVVCPKCDSIYRFEECIIQSGTQLLSKHCSYVAFKNHPQRWHRAPCNSSSQNCDSQRW